MNEFRIEQPSLVQALDKYREMEKVLEEEYDSLQDVIIQSSNEWRGAASEALISEMEYFLNEGDYNTAYENVKIMRMCMEDTLEQVNALLARSEEFPKQLQSSTYSEPMRPVIGDNTVRNGGVLYLDYGKANIVPDLCDQVYEAAEYLGNVLKQYMEDCEGIMDGIPTYISRVDEAVRKIKRIENYKLSFQKYVQGVMALENDVAVRLAGMKGDSGVDVSTMDESDSIGRGITRTSESEKYQAAEEILIRKLEAQGITDAKEQQKIVDVTSKMHPDMLTNLYITSLYSSATSDDVYEQIMIEYMKYEEMSSEMEQHLIDEYLATPAESQQIMNDIFRDNPEDMKKICSAYGNDSSVKEEAMRSAITNYAKQNPIIGEYYVGKYKYPVEYIEGILFDYEGDEKVLNDDGEWVHKPHHGGDTIGYGHDIKEGEELPDELTEAEAVQLAIRDLDMQYDIVLTTIKQINEMTGMDISIEDFTENERMFFADFSFNRGKGLQPRPDLEDQGQPHTSLALLIIAVYEKDYSDIKEILATEIYNEDGERMDGLILRREDEYEILTQGNYERLRN